MMDWKSFWDDYRKKETDLFVQVGKTVGGKPIPRNEFDRYLLRLRMSADLRANDRLIDICCGNGLVTMALRNEVSSVCGVDFCGRFVEEARQLADADPSARFEQGDAIHVLEESPDLLEDVTKCLMSDSLGYFDPTTYRKLLSVLFRNREKAPTRVLITGIPMAERKWEFYNTFQRRMKHLSELVGLSKNSGMGRWWSVNELVGPLESLGLRWRFDSCSYRAQSYRSDLIIYNAKPLERHCLGRDGFAYWGTPEKGFAIHADPSRIDNIDVQSGSDRSEGFWNTIILERARFEVDPAQEPPDPKARPIIRAWVSGTFQALTLPCRYGDELLDQGYSEIFYNPLHDYRHFRDIAGRAAISADTVVLDHTNSRDGAPKPRIFAKGLVTS